MDIFLRRSPAREPEGGHVYFERQMTNGSGNGQFVCGSSARGTLREGSCLGTLKNM